MDYNFKLTKFRSGPMNLFADKLLLSEINSSIVAAHDAFEKLHFRAALKAAFFDLQAARQRYMGNTVRK